VAADGDTVASVSSLLSSGEQAKDEVTSSIHANGNPCALDDAKSPPDANRNGQLSIAHNRRSAERECGAIHAARIAEVASYRETVNAF
jgi:hypothetical protein